MEEGNCLVYKDIWYGGFTSETNDDYNDHHIIDFKMFKNIFHSLGFKFTLSQSNQLNSSIYLGTLDDGQKIYNVMFETLKHSGSKNNKMRAHINPNTVKSVVGENVWLFGAYSTGDEVLIVISDISKFVEKSQIKKNNSSFWIGDIDDLFKIYTNKEYIWYRRKDNVVLQGITLSKLNNYSTNEISDKFFSKSSGNLLQPGNTKDHSINYDIEPAEVDMEKLAKITSDAALPRNPLYRNIAIEKANFTCEACGKTKTFLDKQGNEYFEGHHLIMYNLKSQKRYDKSLDIPRNIVCLCPECHKKIHYSNDTMIKDMIIQLFYKHKDLFLIYDIESLDDILDDYYSFRKASAANE